MMRGITKMKVTSIIENKSSIASEIRGALEQVVKTGSLTINIHNKSGVDLLFSNEKVSTGNYALKLYTQEIIDRDSVPHPEHTKFAKLKNLKWDISVKA
jgi:hypothetical protein